MSTDTTPPDGRGLSGILRVAVTVALASALVAWALIVALDHMLVSDEADRVSRAEVFREDADDRGALWVPVMPTADVPVDPVDAIWDGIPYLESPLFRQTDAMPMLEEISVPSAEIRAVSDGSWIVWRLAWADETEDKNVDSGRFSDAAALQFPVEAGAPHTMGDDRHAVHILHWKGIWQHDLDEHFQDVQDLHPNYWTDLYWFADGPAPNRVPDDFSDPRSHAWFAAYQAGNPMADFLREKPVEELSATGFGSLTSHDESATDGRGVWREGRWFVTFVRPLKTEDPSDYQFHRGGVGSIGVAVWNGSDGNVGGRKHWGNWVEFVVSP